MRKSSDFWLEKQPSLHTRYCYYLDSKRLLNHAKKPLPRITLADLQSFARHLVDLELAPISRTRILAGVKSLFAFGYRLGHFSSNPASELALPAYENRLAS